MGIAVQTTPLHPRLRRFHDLSVGSAVLVTSVVDQSPAQRGGLEKGDLIVAFDERSVENIDDLHRCLADHQPLEAVSVDVLRGSARRRLVIIPEPSPRG